MKGKASHLPVAVLVGLAVIVVVMASFALGCAKDADAAVSSTTVGEAALSSSTTVPEAAPTILELAVGRYSGEYHFVDPWRDDVSPLTVEIGPDGSVALTAAAREGGEVQCSGRVSADGTVVAAGRPPGSGGDVTLEGKLAVVDGAVTIEGSWLTSHQERGTWVANKTTD